MPELSFEDLLDPSEKSNNNSAISSTDDDEALVLDLEGKTNEGDSLNTPGPKKRPNPHNNSDDLIEYSSAADTEEESSLGMLEAEHEASDIKPIATASSMAVTPVVLNSKNILPKGQATQVVRVIPNKGVVAGNAGLAGKTAIKTSNGQVIYLQKSPAAVTANKGKTVSIQVVRQADGSFKPLKTGTNIAKTITLSPTNAARLGAAKISSTTAGQVVVKAAVKTEGEEAKKFITLQKPAVGSPNINKIMVQSANGKQIVVSPQQLLKLSPKPGAVNITKLQASQVPGKPGIQYVKVLSSGNKMTPVVLNNSSDAKVATTSSTSNVSAAPIRVPQKFTIVRSGSGATGKLVLNQSPKDSSGTPLKFSPMTSKVVSCNYFCLFLYIYFSHIKYS